MSDEQLRADLVEVLADARGPTTTSAARIAVTEHRGRFGLRPVVAEEVYRALLTLQRRGVVRRVHHQPGRHAYWELTHSQQVGQR
jgi:Fe2+ or Zn2+ uptake regulation protein